MTYHPCIFSLPSTSKTASILWSESPTCNLALQHSVLTHDLHWCVPGSYTDEQAQHCTQVQNHPLHKVSISLSTPLHCIKKNLGC